MGGPKKVPHPMTYYIIINKINGKYFVNKSTHPEASVRHHFNRAKNPERKDYNGEFYTELREYGFENFDISYSLDPPLWMNRRAHYMPAIPELSIEQMRGHYEPIRGTKDEEGNKRSLPKGYMAAIKQGIHPKLN